MAEKVIKKQNSKATAVKADSKTKAPVKSAKTEATKAKLTKKAEVKIVEKKTESKSTAPVFDLSGKKTGTISLPKELFAGKVNDQLMEQAIRVYLTNQRQGTSSTKTRSEVKGSRRKVWRQKGTGRARHGSITGPIFVGGGIVNGPKPRNFELKMPKKMKIQALASALSEKNNGGMVFVIDGKMTGKTKEFASMLKAIVVSEKKKSPSVLFIRSKNDVVAYKASRNVKNVDVTTGSDINTYEIVRSKALVVSKDAIDEMKSAFIKA